MTRIEAIERIKNDIELNHNCLANEYITALDMAIEALQREQQRREDIYKCQHCLGEVHKNYIYCPFCGERIEALETEPCEDKRTDKCTGTHACDCINRQDAIEALDQDVMGGLNYRRILRLLPSADRPTGHWIGNDNGTFSCSNCQSWIPEEQHHYARHCLYCGARMESDTDGSD